jgi:hypothetical protein
MVWSFYSLRQNAPQFSRAAEAADLVPISIRQVQKLSGGFHSPGGGVDADHREELKPRLPIAGQTHVAKQLVVVLAVFFEI